VTQVPIGDRNKSMKDARRVMWWFGATAVGVACFVGLASLTGAQPTVPRFEPQAERRIDLQDVLLDTLRVESTLQGWTLRKVCLDGQAYWVGFTELTPTGLAVAYKDGKPEQCARRR